MTKTTTETDAAPAAVVMAAPPQRDSRLWELLNKTLFSTKLSATAVACWYLWGDHWSDIKVLNGFDKDDGPKITAFVDLCRSKNDTLKYIMLGFLGFTTATGIGAGMVTRFSQTTTATAPIKTQSTKNLD